MGDEDTRYRSVMPQMDEVVIHAPKPVSFTPSQNAMTSVDNGIPQPQALPMRSTPWVPDYVLNYTESTISPVRQKPYTSPERKRYADAYNYQQKIKAYEREGLDKDGN